MKRVNLFAFDERLVQEQIRFKNESVAWFALVSELIQHNLYDVDESDAV